VSATVIGEFTARGGLSSTIEASYPNPDKPEPNKGKFVKREASNGRR